MNPYWFGFWFGIGFVAGGVLIIQLTLIQFAICKSLWRYWRGWRR